MADIFLRPLDQFLKRCSFWKSNYRSQVKLQESALDHLREDTEKRSMAVSYFCSERKNDLNSHASNRAISAFFENKALGMSMEYELRASLLDLISAKTGKIDQFEVVTSMGSALISLLSEHRFRILHCPWLHFYQPPRCSAQWPPGICLRQWGRWQLFYWAECVSLFGSTCKS